MLKHGFKAWLKDVEKEILLQPRQARRCMPNNDLVTMVVEYAPGDLLTRDVLGMEGALWHLLERSRVFLNDRCPVTVMVENGVLRPRTPSCACDDLSGFLVAVV